MQGRIFRAKLTLISSPTAGWLDKKAAAAAISLIAAEDRPKPGDPPLSSPSTTSAQIEPVTSAEEEGIPNN